MAPIHRRRAVVLLSGALLLAAAGAGVLAADSPAPPDHGRPAARPAAIGEPGETTWSWRSAGTASQEFTIEPRGLRAVPMADGSRLSLDGSGRTAAPGAPDLPVLARVRPGLPGFTAHVALKPVSWIEVTNIDVAPVATRVLEDLTTNAPSYRLDSVRAAAVYGTDAFWPPELATVQEAWQGTQKLVRVECRPLQFNPVRKIVRYAARMEGVLTFEPEDKREKP